MKSFSFLDENHYIFQTTRFNHTCKDHSTIETHRLKNVVIFIQTVLSFVLSRKIIFLFRFCFEVVVELFF